MSMHVLLYVSFSRSYHVNISRLSEHFEAIGAWLLCHVMLPPSLLLSFSSFLHAKMAMFISHMMLLLAFGLASSKGGTDRRPSTGWIIYTCVQ